MQGNSDAAGRHCELGDVVSAAASDSSAMIAARIAQRFDAENVVASSAELAGYEVDGMRPAAAMFAKSPDEISEILKFAEAEKLAVIPCGARTKLGIGMPPARYDIALDLSRMNRVLAYEPRDLTLGVEPGIKLATLWKLLTAEKQWLPMLAPFGERATVGGTLAADSTNPLRHSYGGLRDFTLGLEFVTGYGAIAKSGGRVVKNVSGYDSHKLLIGSLGTLAVITRANFKTFPFPPVRRTFVTNLDKLRDCFEFWDAIRKAGLEPRFVELISPQAEKIMAARTETPLPVDPDRWSIALGVAASERVFERHSRELSALAAQAKAREFSILGGEVALGMLDGIREFVALALAADRTATIFRIAVLPSAMEALAERLNNDADDGTMSSAMVLRPHGLIYFALMPSAAGTFEQGRLVSAVEKIFRFAEEAGAKARIEFAPIELKRAVNVWGAARPDFELMRRVKKVFDPGNVLSPGRFAGGI
jgi:glycolate oxidase FAD binding subunit